MCKSPLQTLPLRDVIISLFMGVFRLFPFALTSRKIYAHNQPLPKSTENAVTTIQTSAVSFNVAIFALFGVGFLHASFAVFIVAVRLDLLHCFVQSLC
jgi:hypothetical protein